MKLLRKIWNSVFYHPQKVFFLSLHSSISSRKKCLLTSQSTIYLGSLYLGGKHPWVEAAQPFGTTCFATWLASWGKGFSLYPAWISLQLRSIVSCLPTMHHCRAWLHLLKSLPIDSGGCSSVLWSQLFCRLNKVHSSASPSHPFV